MTTSAERYCNEEQNKTPSYSAQLNDLRHQRNPRALNSPDRTGLKKSVQICEICGTLDRINSSFEWRQVQNDTAMRNKYNI